jgi:hypothetical protein
MLHTVRPPAADRFVKQVPPRLPSSKYDFYVSRRHRPVLLKKRIAKVLAEDRCPLARPTHCFADPV